MNPLPVADAAPVSAQVQAWERSAQAAGSWFFWIAGLTVINLVTSLLGSDTGFTLSLMPPMAMGYYAHESAHRTVMTVVAIVLGLLCAGTFVLLGLFGRKGARWALVTGMVLFGIDLLFWALGQGWLAVAIHAYALWRIGRGLSAASALGAARRRQAQQAAAAAPVYAWGASPGSPTPEAPGVWPPAPQAEAASVPPIGE